MRVAVVAAMVMALSVSSAMAASDISGAAAPLAPAKPAGVAQAQLLSTPVWVLLGIGAAVAIVGIAVSNGSQSQNYVAPTTGTQ